MDSRWFGSGGTNRVVKYRVRWEGYRAADDTWQSVEETGWPASPAILEAYRTYHDTHPRKAADPRVVEAIGALAH